MTSKRSRLEVFLSVLRVINQGVQKPTHIMYKSNLSWVPLKEVLESLMAQGLVVKEERPKGRKKIRQWYNYKITEKGKQVLAYFERGLKLLDRRVILWE